MSTTLYTAPAGAGKTTFVIRQAHVRAQRWQSARIVVASRRQAAAAHRLLALLGGGMGVRIQTIHDLAREILDLTASPLTLISDPIQVRFVRSMVDDARLHYYAPLSHMPGFIRALRELFSEFTYDLVAPSDFERAVRCMGEPERLAELARLYAMYRHGLQDRKWVDRAGMLLHARCAVKTSPELLGNWNFLGVDGFMRFRPAELALLHDISQHADTVCFTLIQPSSDTDLAAAASFAEAIEQVETTFSVRAQPLSTQYSRRLSPQHRFIAAPDIANEVRVALRWLKERIVIDGLQSSQVALLARDIRSYRDAIIQIAREFEMPVLVSGGFSVRSNPAVDALLALLNLVAPKTDPHAPPRQFPFRATISAWRSPYFTWVWPHEGLAITSRDADRLDRLGRWARVTAGAEQWDDAFGRWLQHLQHEHTPLLDDGNTLVTTSSALSDIQLLRRKWALFRQSITPPQGQHPVHVFVHWLEDLIGCEPDEREQSEIIETPKDSFSLNMVASIRNIDDSWLVARDIAALTSLKEVLRSMVWAAEALQLPDVTFAEFLTDFAGALEAAHYETRQDAGREVILALNVTESLGLRFGAVALLGMAEGAFPAVVREDTFLRGDDRVRLQHLGLQVEPSPRSEESALFYLARTRTDGPLLFTRPCLAQGGAEWQASPFWEQLITNSEQLGECRNASSLSGMLIASYPELLLALAFPDLPPLQRRVMETVAGKRLAQWMHGASMTEHRFHRRYDGHDGDLSRLRSAFALRFGPDHTWSAGRLETYRACPYRFFASHILYLEERPEPALGLDNRQLGFIFHRALELVFRRGADKANDADALTAIWQGLADELLDTAPETYGFRPTAWWPQIREQIIETVSRTLVALAAESDGWRPRAFEAAFGFEGHPVLAVTHDERVGEALRLRGVIDRIDSDGRGNLRVIDYKRGGVWGYNDRALAEGKYLQLPLYALAASQALEHGRPVDGFYWSITRAEPSKLRLSKIGVEEAASMALAHAWDAVEGARAGRFQPLPPSEGCPDFCPAAAFCWHYRPRP